MNPKLRDSLPPFGLPEKVLAAAAVSWIASWLSASATLRLLTSILVTLVGLIVVTRVARFFVSKLIWRLRYRLLVAFLFITVIPVLLIVAFALAGGLVAAGQVAVYLATSRLDRELEQLSAAATAISHADNNSIRLKDTLSARFPGLKITISPGATAKPGHGLTVYMGVLSGWASETDNGRTVTILAPLDRAFFNRLDPDLGPVYIIPREEGSFHLNNAASFNVSEVVTPPPPVSSFDLPLSLGVPMELHDWAEPSKPQMGIFGVVTRTSALYSRLVSPGVDSSGVLIPVLFGIGFAILIAELASFIIGISLTRTMTAAVHELYEGTQRVMQGDFTHRIPVSGNEQIADLSRSFNTMTENVERLLKVSKENERMQAELEIARRVQQQLFPSSMPHSETLEIRAVCQPARQVSGDYYDYQALGDGKLVLALGDVAGKGISAALLMASLQSTLRVQLREWQTSVSTERLVTGLNQHLFLNTTPEKYATFFLAIYDEATGMLEYTNAGHLPPLLVREGAVTRLDTNGMVVGAFAGAQYDSSHLQLQSGDLLVCYTDGVTELENEFAEQFGEERLMEVLIRTGKDSLDHVEAAVLDAAAKFSGSPEAQDDLTMLMVRRK